MASKDEEAEYLAAFAEEYLHVTGRSLDVIAATERPDFIARVTGWPSEVGIELVQVMVDPESRMWRRILDHEAYMDPFDTAHRLQEIVYRKDEKRASLGWQLPQSSMLVLMLRDAPIEDVSQHLEEELLQEMQQTGFTEIWVADLTIREAYETVQLMCVKGDGYVGLHDRHPISWKPYG
jgi:hypothetical protein